MRRLGAALAVLAALTAACGGESIEGKFGQELYEASCAACHLSTGDGGSGFPAIAAGSNSVGLTDEQLAGVIRVGPGTMPGFSRFTDAQVESVVEYVRQLQAGG